MPGKALVLPSTFWEARKDTPRAGALFGLTTANESLKAIVGSAAQASPHLIWQQQDSQMRTSSPSQGQTRSASLETMTNGSSTIQSASQLLTAIARKQAAPSFLPDAPPGASASHLVAEWHGQVLEIQGDFIVAELHGTFGQGVAGSVEEATIPRTEISPDDEPLVREGAFFRLCISYEVSLHGTRRKYTEVIFRRMPAYRQEELDAAREQAADFSRAIRVE